MFMALCSKIFACFSACLFVGSMSNMRRVPFKRDYSYPGGSLQSLFVLFLVAPPCGRQLCMPSQSMHLRTAVPPNKPSDGKSLRSRLLVQVSEQDSLKLQCRVPGEFRNSLISVLRSSSSSNSHQQEPNKRLPNQSVEESSPCFWRSEGPKLRSTRGLEPL